MKGRDLPRGKGFIEQDNLIDRPGEVVRAAIEAIDGLPAACPGRETCTGDLAVVIIGGVQRISLRLPGSDQRGKRSTSFDDDAAVGVAEMMLPMPETVGPAFSATSQREALRPSSVVLS